MEEPRNPPEVAPEAAPEVPGMVPEPPGSRWLTAPDVATLIGHSERGARSWLDRYDIPFRDARPRRWSEAAILDRLSTLGEPLRKIPEVSPELPRNAPEVAPEGSGSPSEPIEARFRLTAAPGTALVPFERVTELTAGLVERISELTVRNEALALEVGQLRERTGGHQGQLAAKDETIAELRRRAEVAEAELAGARLRLAEVSGPAVVVVTGPEATEGQDATTTTSEAYRPAQRRWWRLWRAWRGR